MIKPPVPWWAIPLFVIASATEDLKTKWFLWKCKMKCAHKKTPDEIYEENLHPPKDPSRGPYTP